MSADDQSGGKIFHYEDGLLVFDARLQAVEQKQSEAEKREKAYRDQQLLINKWVMRFTGMLVVLSTLTVIFNGLYTSITKTSADAAKSAADTAAATLRASDQFFQQDQRAYIWVRFVGFVDGDLSQGNRVGVNLQTQNYGKTPAQYVQHYGIITLQNGLGVESEKHAFDASAQITHVAPDLGSPVLQSSNRTEYFTISVNKHPLPTWTEKEIADIQNKKRFLYVAGTIEYSDAFNLRHRTEFCLYWDAKEEDVQLCGSHNKIE